jgi:hypothetical protein
LATTDKGSLFGALHAVQAEALAIRKDSRNPHFGNKYISLDKLVPQVLPLLNEVGVVLTQLPHHIDGAPALITRLTHAPSGEFIESIMPLLLDRENSQGVGSALTYARRYMLLALLGLVADEDDDGEKASKVEVVNKRRTQPRSAAGKATKATPADESNDY